MDASALIGQAQNAYSAGLQSRTANAANRASGLTDDQKRAKETSDNFESLFIGQMLEHMMQGVEVDPEFGGGHAEEMWKSMLNQEYGKHIVNSGGLGISKQVMDSMLKAQEEQTVTQQKLTALDIANNDAGADTTAGSLATAATLRR